MFNFKKKINIGKKTLKKDEKNGTKREGKQIIKNGC